MNQQIMLPISHYHTSVSPYRILNSTLCRYVKYLYPYECEIENLSDPQELQVAIDSHKRDRRQSDTVEFLHQPLSGGRNTLESLTPVTNTITATQGLQIINSPSVALPHGAIPPYSGSFIVTGPGGTQMVTPQISGPPQLVQMTTPQGIPIMVPTLTPGGKHELGQSVAEDHDDASSQASSDASDRESAPPAKRIALDGGRSIATTARIPPAGFVMTPTRPMVPTSHFTTQVPPQVLQVGPNSHIPIIMPTTTATSFISRMSPMETQVSNGVIVKDSLRHSPLENGICSTHLATSGSSKRTQVIPASHLLHMAPPTHMPVVVPATTSVALGHNGDKQRHTSESEHGESVAVSVTDSPEHRKTPEKKHKPSHGGSSTPVSGTSSLKMPFANIAIQSGTYILHYTHFSMCCNDLPIAVIQ